MNDYKDAVEGIVAMVGGTTIGYLMLIGGGWINPLRIAGGSVLTDMLILSLVAILGVTALAVVFALVLVKYLSWRYGQRIYVADDGVLKELEEWR